MLGATLGIQAAQSSLSQQAQNAVNRQAAEVAQQQHLYKVGKDANEELELRENNPGVKAAWEQYQIMLKLSRK